MKILTGYLQADDGKATVCGLDVKADPIAVKKKIGYLPEANPCILKCMCASIYSLLRASIK